MRTLVHLSDLHFGRTEPRVIAALGHAVDDLRPDLLAVSGDLTQRARAAQFVQARDFLRQRRFPQIVVPGNHDVPLFDLVTRFSTPLAGYTRHITTDLEPVFEDDELVVVGLSSVRSGLFHGGGRVNEGQVARAAARFQSAGERLKVVVTHHPFDLPAGHGDEHLIGRSRMAMEALARAGADVFLAGHLHVSHVGHTAERYRIAGHSALVVQAGTMSTRERGEPNTFNVLRLAPAAITLERRTWRSDDDAFHPSTVGRFVRTAEGWAKRAPDAPEP